MHSTTVNLQTYEQLMSPVLKLMSDQKSRTPKEIFDDLKPIMKWTQLQLDCKLEKSNGCKLKDRIGWAIRYLYKADLLSRPSRGNYMITQEGIKNKNESITDKFLMQYPQFVAYKTNSKNDTNIILPIKEEINNINSLTPDELFENTFISLQNNLEDELLQTLKSNSPGFFEELVVKLLEKMGYGNGVSVGKSGDGGVDGIIYQDELGLDKIFIQAKRWENNVSRPELQQFVGALTGKKAKKGVFITTALFCAGVKEYTTNLEHNIALIDGPALCKLMIKYNVGVVIDKVYEIKKLDANFFEDINLI